MHTPVQRVDLDRLRQKLDRSRPGHQVVLSADDTLKLLDAYEDALREIDELESYKAQVRWSSHR